jgi:hypothetical protein
LIATQRSVRKALHCLPPAVGLQWADVEMQKSVSLCHSF